MSRRAFTWEWRGKRVYAGGAVAAEGSGDAVSLAGKRRPMFASATAVCSNGGIEFRAAPAGQPFSHKHDLHPHTLISPVWQED